jgi:hypothetical protein
MESNDSPKQSLVKSELTIGLILESCFYTILFLSLAFYGTVMILRMPVDGEFTGFLVYVMSPISISLGLWGTFRSWNYLTKTIVKTGLPASQNRQLLVDFINWKQYDIIEETHERIIAVFESELSFSRLWIKHITFIIMEEKVSFNIQKQYLLGNPPVLFSQLLLKYELKSYFRKHQKRM